jgi:hypothetical protein
MKTLLLALVTMVWLGTPAFAQSPVITQKDIASLPINGIRRKPKITLQDGLKIAERFAKRKRIHLADYFLLEARMIWYGGKDDPKEPRWSFHWVGADKPMGVELWIDVSMDGMASRPFTM